MNDADAAGIAEMQFGAGVGSSGVVMMVTLGTGIGSALFVDGVLVSNTELGHLELRGKDAERRAAESVREAEDLSWKKWAKRLDEYFDLLQALFCARSLHRGRRDQQEGRQVPPAPLQRDSGRSRAAAERRRHRRGRARARAVVARGSRRLIVLRRGVVAAVVIAFAVGTPRIGATTGLPSTAGAT